MLFVWLSLRNSLIYAGPIVINMSLLGLQTVTNNSNLVQLKCYLQIKQIKEEARQDFYVSFFTHPTKKFKGKCKLIVLCIHRIYPISSNFHASFLVDI